MDETKNFPSHPSLAANYENTFLSSTMGRRAKNKQGPPAPYVEVKQDFESTTTRRSGGKRKPAVDSSNGRPAKKVKADGVARDSGKKGGKGKKKGGKGKR